MTEPEDKKSDEIDLLEIIRKIWKGRKTILITALIFLIIGIFLAFISPKQYQSSVSLLVEPGGSNPAANSAILKQLSALTGVPTGGSQDALTPALYPLVVGSEYFRLEVLYQKVTDPKTKTKMTLSEYFDNHPPKTLQGLLMKYTIGLPGTILGAIRGQKKDEKTVSPVRTLPKASILPANLDQPGIRVSVLEPSGTDSASQMTPDEKSKIRALSSRIKVEIKKGSLNLLTVTVNMDDPLVTKELAGSVVTTLTHYIIDYRTRKVKNDREFIEDLHAGAEKKYKRAQQILASYNDRNQNVVRSAARTEGESLKAEYNLTFNVYTSLSQLLEQAKINVQENTPVFTMIDPPSDATKISSGRNIVLIMLFLGILAGVGIVFGKPALAKLRGQLKGT